MPRARQMLDLFWAPLKTSLFLVTFSLGKVIEVILSLLAHRCGGRADWQS